MSKLTALPSPVPAQPAPTQETQKIHNKKVKKEREECKERCDVGVCVGERVVFQSERVKQ